MRHPLPPPHARALPGRLALPLILRLLLPLSLAGPAHAANDDEAEQPKFEGAIGLVASYGPEYAGAEKSGIGFTPAGFVRYGRWSLSGAGGFTTRRNDDVERGVAASVVERDNLRVSMALRFDNGRSDSGSDRLDGMGDIDPTVRGKLQLRWSPARDWSLNTSISIDVLGKGGGWVADAGASRTWRWSPQTRLQVSGGFSWADARYLQNWYGVTPAQAERSGYPVYTPGAGLRDVDLSITLRTELGPHWAGFVRAGASRQLGPAADSPLTERAEGWSLGGGLVWRF